MIKKRIEAEITDPYSLIEQAEQSNSHNELEIIINALANLGEPSVIALLEKTPKLVTSRLHRIAAKVFAQMGWPLNAKALEFIISDASNINSSTYEISRSALLAVGKVALPEITSAFEFYRRDLAYNSVEIQTLEEIEGILNR